jgi:hypothetical protein
VCVGVGFCRLVCGCFWVFVSMSLDVGVCVVVCVGESVRLSVSVSYTLTYTLPHNHTLTGTQIPT